MLRRRAQFVQERSPTNRLHSPERTIDKETMKTVVLTCAACALIVLGDLLWSAVRSKPEVSASSTPPSIDGTYELTERVMTNGAVLRAPAIVGLYTNADGRFDLNLFIKKGDGAVASESTVGRFSFTAAKYCEWTIYTIRKDLDKAGITTEAPPVTDHCTPVASKDGRFNFSPPGEGVEVSYGTPGFTASIGGEFVDHWTKIR